MKSAWSTAHPFTPAKNQRLPKSLFRRVRRAAMAEKQPDAENGPSILPIDRPCTPSRSAAARRINRGGLLSRQFNAALPAHVVFLSPVTFLSNARTYFFSRTKASQSAFRSAARCPPLHLSVAVTGQSACNVYTKSTTRAALVLPFTLRTTNGNFSPSQKIARERRPHRHGFRIRNGTQ